MAYNIAIIEDLLDIRDHLKGIISCSDSFQVVSMYVNAEEALNFMPKMKVDVAIVDIGLPGMSGIEFLRRLAPTMPDTLFLMFTIFEEDSQVFESLKAGAHGYLLKSSSDKRIIRALEDIVSGGSPMSPKIARKVTDYFSTRKSRVSDDLSQREMELLALLSSGMLYKEIGSNLKITTGTVKQHIHKIYKKLHVQNRTEAANYFYRRS